MGLNRHIAFAGLGVLGLLAASNPADETPEQIKARKLAAARRAKQNAQRAARSQMLNPKYTSEPQREDFPSRQAYRRAVRVWEASE